MSSGGSSVLDYLITRTEQLEENQIEEFFVPEKADYVARLLDGHSYLLVGSRGVGKSMLLRSAELKADKEFEQDRVLAVYVTFENSLVMERMQATISSKYYNPFTQWTFAKIIRDVLLKSEKLGLMTVFDEALEEIYGKISLKSMKDALDHYIRILENKNIQNATDLRFEAQKKLVREIGNEQASSLLDALENPNATKELLNQIIEDNGLKMLVLLFDEAAHALVPQQQETFFTIFKSLKHKKIACKAAVYPAATHYGRDFDPAHDSTMLTIIRDENDSDYLQFFNQILERRIPQSTELWRRLKSSDEILPTLCYSCFGNPRYLFLLIEKFDRLKGSSATMLQEVCRKFVQEDLWPFYNNTGKRSPKFAIPSSLGFNFINNSVMPTLTDNNNRWRDKSFKELSIYFTIGSDVHKDLKPILSLLLYSDVLGFRGELKTGQKATGHLYAINIALAISQSILKYDKKTEHSYVNEVRLLRRQRFTQYTSKTHVISELLDELSKHVGIYCSKCGIRIEKGWGYCPQCSTPVPQEKSLYYELRNHPIENLALSLRMRIRIKKHEQQSFKVIGDILDATLSDIDAIKYVGFVRSRLIKGAAEEYVAS